MTSRRSAKPLAAVVLVLCLAGMAVLGWLTWEELQDRRAGEAYYAALAQRPEGTPGPEAPAPTSVPEAEEAAVPPLSAVTDMPEVSAAPEAPALPTPWVNPSAVDFPSLWRTSPDVKAWITIDGTCIDYPVVQGTDNLFYLSHLPDGTANKAGSILMDVANAPDFTDDVTILHGHHMRSGAMFGDLDEYRKPAYWEAHPTLRLYTPRGDWQVEIIAACTVDGRSFAYAANFADEEAFNAYVQSLRDKSGFYTETEAVYGDKLLLLSTCAYNFVNARFVVLGKIVME